MSPRDRARARVERLLAAAQPLADESSPERLEVRRALAASSGLSEAGIDLALSEHLELRPGDEEIDRLLDAAAPVDERARVWVLLSAHVCTAALRALAVALAAAPRVSVRPSRRDPVLAEHLARRLGADPALAALGAEVAVVSELSPAPGDHVFVYGADATLERVSRGWPATVTRTLSGTGFGVAALGPSGDPRAAAEALARDVVVFDQKGCLSPRIAFVEGAERARDFGRLLHEALDAWQGRVPRGALESDERAELTRHGDLARSLGELYLGEGHAVSIDLDPHAVPLPPAARAVHVVAAHPDRVGALIAPYARYVTTIGAAGDSGGGLTGALAAASPSARLAELGEMQRPPLDGLVDRRR